MSKPPTSYCIVYRNPFDKKTLECFNMSRLQNPKQTDKIIEENIEKNSETSRKT